MPARPVALLLVLLAPDARVYERVNDSWEVCVSLSDGQFQQVSFVNSINTIKGGTHVAQVTDQVAKFLLAKAQKKLGKANAANLKLHQVKNHLWIFVNALIVNPAFDSQTKETLNTRPADFGSTCKLPEEFLKKSESLSQHAPLANSLLLAAVCELLTGRGGPAATSAVA